MKSNFAVFEIAVFDCDWNVPGPFLPFYPATTPDHSGHFKVVLTLMLRNQTQYKQREKVTIVEAPPKEYQQIKSKYSQYIFFNSSFIKEKQEKVHSHLIN